MAVGYVVGVLVGVLVGSVEGKIVGVGDGADEGYIVGPKLGPSVGIPDGLTVGLVLGDRVGLRPQDNLRKKLGTFLHAHCKQVPRRTCLANYRAPSQFQTYSPRFFYKSDLRASSTAQACKAHSL